MTTSDRLAVGIWGTFDVENYGDQLFPRIAVHELQRRLGGIEVRPFSPFGWLHPTRMDGGEPAESLGAWDPSRLVELAAELRCVLIGGGEIIHTRDELLAPAYGASTSELRRLSPSRYFIEGLGPELERVCPVVWHAVGLPFDPTADEAARLRAALEGRPYVAVRDEVSRARVLDAGVNVEITVVPDSALLVRRVLPDALLRKRLDYLRAMGWYPSDGNAVVLQGNRDLLPHVGDLVAIYLRMQAEHPDLRPVLAQTGVCHGDDELAAALAAALPMRAFRLPPEAGVEDLAAAIANARVFVGSSLHGSITALAFGKPFVTLNFTAESKLDGFARLVGSTDRLAHHPTDVYRAWTNAMTTESEPALVTRLQRRVDAHFDRVAEIIEGSGPRPCAEPDGRHRRYRSGPLEAELRAVRSSHDALERRVRAERLRLADHVQEIRDEHMRSIAQLAEMQTAIDEQRKRADDAQREAAALDRELTKLLATKTFRYLGPLRRAYARLLRARLLRRLR